MASPMLLELSKIQSPRERLDYTWPPSALDTADDEFDVVEPIRLHVEIQKTGNSFRLVGRATTKLELSCSRCVEPYRIPVDAAFDSMYLPLAANTGEGEREIGPKDLDTSFYQNDVIDLGELLREQFYLALPMKPLCGENCRGLCPHCGTNLNRGSCGCRPAWEDPRLAGLKALLDDSGRDDTTH